MNFRPNISIYGRELAVDQPSAVKTTKPIIYYNFGGKQWLFAVARRTSSRHASVLALDQVPRETALDRVGILTGEGRWGGLDLNLNRRWLRRAATPRGSSSGSQ